MVRVSWRSVVSRSVCSGQLSWTLRKRRCRWILIGRLFNPLIGRLYYYTPNDVGLNQFNSDDKIVFKLKWRICASSSSLYAAQNIWRLLQQGSITCEVSFKSCCCRRLFEHPVRVWRCVRAHPVPHSNLLLRGDRGRQEAAGERALRFRHWWPAIPEYERPAGQHVRIADLLCP